MLLSVFDDVIISFRWTRAPPLPRRRISQSAKTRAANVRLLPRELGPQPGPRFASSPSKPLSPPVDDGVTAQKEPVAQKLILNYQHINFSSADEDLFARSM